MKALFIIISMLASIANASTLDLEYRGNDHQVFQPQHFGAASATNACNVDLTKDAMSYAAVTAIIADWRTTQNVAKYPNQYTESGLLASQMIGTKPSMSQINGYFIGVLATNLAIRCYAPEWVSHLVLSISIGSHGIAAIRNHRIGARFSF